MQINSELFEKAKKTKSVEELMSLAKEHGAELTNEDAAAYFAQLHKSGELSDEELSSVAGGGCQANTLVQVNGVLKEGDLIRVYKHTLGAFASCKCGNGTFRVAELTPFHKMIRCVCTRCGEEFIFFESAIEIEIHKVVL